MGEPFTIHKYLFGGTTRQTVYKSLNAGALRGRAIAQNIANINVPNYKRKEISFEKELRKALKIKLEGARTNDKHIEIGKKAALKNVKPYSYEPFDPTLGSGENNVDIDIENAKMAENQILYNYGVKFAGFEKLKSAITGRQK